MIRYVLPVLRITNVIFAYMPRLLDVAAKLKRSAHAALGLAKLCAVVRPVAEQRTHGTTFRAPVLNDPTTIIRRLCRLK